MTRRNRIYAGFFWLHSRRKTINSWIVRGVSFYFGYRILDHEIYGKETAEPLLIFLGLWLCGIAPAAFFDGVRKVGANISSEIEEKSQAMSNNVPGQPKPELESGDRP